MKLLAILILLCAVALIGQQAITGRIPVWSQGRYQSISIEELKAAVAPTEQRLERTDAPILMADQREFDVPCTQPLMVYRNGLLQREGVDYSTGNAVVRFEPFSALAGDLVSVFCYTD